MPCQSGKVPAPCDPGPHVAADRSGTGSYKNRTLVPFTLPSILIPLLAADVAIKLLSICALLVRTIDTNLVPHLPLNVRNAARRNDRTSPPGRPADAPIVPTQSSG
jgi:hypothetical protein